MTHTADGVRVVPAGWTLSYRSKATIGDQGWHWCAPTIIYAHRSEAESAAALMATQDNRFYFEAVQIYRTVNES